MEGVDDVRIVEVHGGRLVGNVHRMVKRKVPHGEGLELRIAHRDATAMLVVHLGKAGCELARTGARRRHHDKRTRGLDELVLPIALLGDDEVDIMRVALDGIVQLAGDAKHLKTAAEHVGSGLRRILREHDRCDGKTIAAEDVG